MAAKNNNIKIQTIAWDIETTSMQKAVQWQSTASDFCRERMPAVIEKAFAFFADDEDCLVIDKIELDLGHFRSEEELEEKLQKSLRQYTADSLVQRSSTILSNGEKYLDGSATLIKQFEYYLLSGSVSWNADIRLFDNSEIIFRTIDKLKVEKLKALLGKIVQQKNALIRLTDFFTRDQSLKLLQKIAIGKWLIDDFFWFTEAFTKITGHKISSSVAISNAYQSVLSEVPSDILVLASAWWRDVVSGGFINAKEKENFLAIISAAASLRNSDGSLLADEELNDASVNTIPQKFLSVFLQVVKAEPDLHVLKEKPVIQETVNGKIFKPVEAEYKFFVENAGIVLLYPYLKNFFSAKGLLTEAHEFKGYKERLMACYWLQFIATGNADIKEYELPLNKILCGFEMDAPVSREWDAVKAGKEESDTFLKAVISNWQKIGNTSPEGFRQSFLVCNGRLTEEDSNWLLYVERRGMDVLLDSLPYPISIIRLPWMNKPLYVQW